MMSWLLLIVLLAAFVAVGTWLWGSVFGRGELWEPLDPDTTRAANLQAVADRDLDAIQFEIVPRGYRPEQVDEVIEILAAQLQEAEESAGRLSPPKKV